MLEFPVEMTTGVAIRSDFERRSAHFVLLVPSGAIETVTITPRFHHQVELGSERIDQCNPSDLIFDRNMIILTINGLFFGDFLRTREWSKFFQSVNSPLELAADIEQASLKIDFERRYFAGVDKTIGRAVEILCLNPCIVEVFRLQQTLIDALSLTFPSRR